MSLALNKLAKWRTILSGQHLGTRDKYAPGVQAMRSLEEARLILRAEANAISALLIAKGVFTVDEFAAQLDVEAVELDKAMARDFPGIRSEDWGMCIFDAELAEVTMREKGFPA